MNDKIYEIYSTIKQKEVISQFPNLEWLNNGSWIKNTMPNWFFYIEGNQNEIFNPNQWEDEEYVIIFPDGKIIHQRPDFSKEITVKDITKIITYLNFK